MPVTPELLDRLSAQLGPAGYSTDPDVIAPKLVEWRQRWRGHTPFLARPSSTAEVAAVVSACAAAGAAITPQGGNTGLVGGQIPAGEILLSLDRMTAVRAIDPNNDSLIVEAGATLASVHQIAAEAGRRFPLSLASQGSASIGGLLSTNAGGVHVMRFGMMRDLTLGLEVVLADGQVLNLLRTLRKNNTGYDLKQAFIGAEGTLGVITAAALKLFAPVISRHVVLVALASADDALTLLARTKQSFETLSAFEIMNARSIALAVANVANVKAPFDTAPAFTALLEFESLDGLGFADRLETFLDRQLQDRLITDAVIARSKAQEEAFWKLRESLSAGHRTGTPQANHDISCPVSMTPALLSAAHATAQELVPGATIVAFGHMGDGNTHLTVMAPQEMSQDAFPRDAISHSIHAVAVGMGGSISAEHGIGVARKADFAAFTDPLAIETMQRIKHALDPQSIMNPRAILPEGPA
jgi:FAD/FMN-containing dehydrogenase